MLERGEDVRRKNFDHLAFKAFGRNHIWTTYVKTIAMLSLNSLVEFPTSFQFKCLSTLCVEGSKWIIELLEIHMNYSVTEKLRWTLDYW